MNATLDGTALIAFLRREPGSQVVTSFLLDPATICSAHAVNLCEAYYDFRRAEGEAPAQAALATLAGLQLAFREDMDRSFWEDVGRIKADHRPIALADCFAIALARRMSAELLTSDHREFDPLVPLGLCRIRFIR
jgi:PIN domain nuclease of toxin-antitoxin system